MRARLREPVTIPRWVLTVKYALFAFLAALTFIRGMVTLDLTTPSSYIPLWAGAVAVGAVVAFVSSLDARGEGAEKWAAAWLAGWLSVVAVNSALVNDGAGWVLVVMVTLLPAARSFALFSKRTSK